MTQTEVLNLFKKDICIAGSKIHQTGIYLLFDKIWFG